jgi:multidrug efflux pump subunit AcrA (membrane-fusion protein)
MNAKPFKVGDQVWPGAAVAELPDLATLEMEGKIEEIDRAQIRAGQEARVRLDALPEVLLPAKLEQLSPMTVADWGWPPTRTFRGFAKLEKIEPRLRPGMNGALDVIVDRIPNAISVPVKALHTVQGRPVVYVPDRRGYRTVEVEVLARNPDEAAVKGIGQGARVALAEPEKENIR